MDKPSILLALAIRDQVVKGDGEGEELLGLLTHHEGTQKV